MGSAERGICFYLSIVSQEIYHLSYVDDNECVWLGTTDGLYRVDNLDNPAPVCVIPKVNVLSLYRDTKGKMWVAAFRQGMYTIENGISQQFVDEQNFLLSNNDIRCFVEDDEGSIWIGTFNGLNKIDTLGNVSCYKKIRNREV